MESSFCERMPATDLASIHFSIEQIYLQIRSVSITKLKDAALRQGAVVCRHQISVTEADEKRIRAIFGVSRGQVDKRLQANAVFNVTAGLRLRSSTHDLGHSYHSHPVLVNIQLSAFSYGWCLRHTVAFPYFLFPSPDFPVRFGPDLSRPYF